MDVVIFVNIILRPFYTLSKPVCGVTRSSYAWRWGGDGLDSQSKLRNN